ncbi:MAG: glycoside hydrolase family 2 TIM barrel-domain containing protein [Chloroherpetonaceae bacterium]
MKRISLIINFLVFIASASLSFAETSHISDVQMKELVPSKTRLVYSLDGAWDVSTDGSTFERINVPVSIQNANRVILQRNFSIDRSMLNSYDWELDFLGFNNEAEVYVNEQFVGKFISNFLRNTISIPKSVLLPANNTLKIIITKSDKYASFANDIYAPLQTSGMQRSILLIASPQLKISSIAYKTKINRDFSSATLQSKISINSKDLDKLFRTSNSDTNKIVSNTRDFALQIVLLDKSTGSNISQSEMIPFRISPQRTITLNYTFNLQNIKAWSFDDPNLYEISCNIYANGNLIDNYSVNCAFRTLTIDSKDNSSKFLMNYQEFHFKAVNYIENIGQNGYFLSIKKIEEDFKKLKVLGANAIVFRYNFPNPYVLSLCDKYGLLALIELPLYNTEASQLGREILLRNVTNQVISLINTYSSHPSIVAVSIGEGLDDSSPEYANYINQISSIIKKESDWLICRTTYPTSPNVNNNNIDFLFFREYISRQKFEKINDDYSRLRNTVAPIPLVMSFGVPIQNDNHNGYSDPLSVEFQSYYIATLYKIALVNNGFGCLIYNFNDYYSDRPILSTRYIDEPITTSGIENIYGKNKSSFDVLKSLFNEERDNIINIGNYSTTAYIFIIISFLLLILLLFLLSRFKRLQEYCMRAALRPFNFYSDIRDQRILSPSYTYIIGFFNALSFGIFVESVAYFYRTNEAFEFFLNIIIPSVDLQKYIYQIIWIPIVGIIVFSLMFIVALYIIAILIKIYAYFKHIHIHQFDAVSIGNWGSLPFIYLLPIDVVLFRLLQIDTVFFIIFGIIFALILISTIFRIFRAVSVVFDIKKSQSYIAGFTTIILILIIVFACYQTQTNLINSMSYLFSNLM